MLRAGVSTTDLLVWSQGRSPQEVAAKASVFFSIYSVILCMLSRFQRLQKRTKFKLIITLNDYWSQGRSPQEVAAKASVFFSIYSVILCMLSRFQRLQKRTKFKLIITLNDYWSQGRSPQEVPAVPMPFLNYSVFA